MCVLKFGYIGIVASVIMSPLYRGGDIMLYLSPFCCSSDQFCFCAFSLSIVQAVKHETLSNAGLFLAHRLRR